jgi:hypothetical protein
MKETITEKLVVPVVVETDAVADERAMMIHSQRA